MKFNYDYRYPVSVIDKASKLLILSRQILCSVKCKYRTVSGIRIKELSFFQLQAEIFAKSHHNMKIITQTVKEMLQTCCNCGRTITILKTGGHRLLVPFELLLIVIS